MMFNLFLFFKIRPQDFSFQARVEGFLLWAVWILQSLSYRWIYSHMTHGHRISLISGTRGCGSIQLIYMIGPICRHATTLQTSINIGFTPEKKKIYSSKKKKKKTLQTSTQFFFFFLFLEQQLTELKKYTHKIKEARTRNMKYPGGGREGFHTCIGAFEISLVWQGFQAKPIQSSGFNMFKQYQIVVVIDKQ